MNYETMKCEKIPNCNKGYYLNDDDYTCAVIPTCLVN